MDDGLKSVTIPFVRPVIINQFIDIIESLSPRIYRIKGVFNSVGTPSTVLFQYVNGRCELAELSNPKTAKRFLTVIGQDLDEGQIGEMFAITQT